MSIWIHRPRKFGLLELNLNESLYQFLIYTHLFGKEKAIHVPIYPTGYFLSLQTLETNTHPLIIKAILVKKKKTRQHFYSLMD